MGINNFFWDRYALRLVPYTSVQYETNVTKGSKVLKKEEKKVGAQELRHVTSTASQAPPAAAPATVATAADATTVATAADATTAVGAAVATNVAVAAATAVTGAGAVAGTVDYRYGFRKSSYL